MSQWLRSLVLMGMPSGLVKFFNTDRGYGFIAPDGGGSDVFVHVHDVEAAGIKVLVAGQLVVYEVGPAWDGHSKAVNCSSVRNASLPSPALCERRHRQTRSIFSSVSNRPV